MPDLPAGPRRRLVVALFSYYEQAGHPSLTAIEGWISPEHGLPATVSKETVRRMLVGLNVPLRWEMAEVVFLALCGMVGHDPESPDRDGCGQPTGMTRREAFHRLWAEAVATPQVFPPVDECSPRKSGSRDQ
ncbi:hypothetical protein H4W32_001650 [Actinophytocola algeriensis]|nr:hypothetical protein [Actinophytocola algeriensis]